MASSHVDNTVQPANGSGESRSLDILDNVSEAAVQKWKPIEDLPTEVAATLSDGELQWIRAAWQDYRSWLEKLGDLPEFQRRFNVEWAAESGNVERVYTIDRGVTLTLVEKGINSAYIPRQGNRLAPEGIEAIMLDAQQTIEGLFSFVKSERRLSKSYTHELHQALLRHQETHLVQNSLGQMQDVALAKGAYKKQRNNPSREGGVVHEYCPPEQVESEMERLLSIAEAQSAAGLPVEVRAAWLHHRFVQIHPYADGNGRVARALASLMLIKEGLFPLLVTSENHTEYVDTLEHADGGNLAPFIRFIVDRQRDATVRASKAVFSNAGRDAEPTTVSEIVNRTEKVLLAKGRTHPENWTKVRAVEEALMIVLSKRLDQLLSELKPLRTGGVHATRRAHTNAHVVEFSGFNQPGPLTVFIQPTAPFRGVLEAYCTISNQELTPRFYVFFPEPPESATERFTPWLEARIVDALNRLTASL